MHEQLCPFERVILSTEFSCTESHKYFYAHKEGIACKNPPARMNCRLIIESKLTVKDTKTEGGKTVMLDTKFAESGHHDIFPGFEG